MHVFLQTTSGTSEGLKVMGGIAVLRLVWAVLRRVRR